MALDYYLYQRLPGRGAGPEVDFTTCRWAVAMSGGRWRQCRKPIAQLKNALLCEEHHDTYSRSEAQTCSSG